MGSLGYNELTCVSISYSFMIINILPASTQSVRALAMSNVFLALTHQYDVDWWKRDIYTYSGGSGRVIGYN